METLAKKLASKISKSLEYDDEKERVIAYGLTAIIQVAVTVFLALLLGFIAGTPVEVLIICFSISTLRKYSGGAHAKYIELCTAMSVILCFVFSLISKYLLAPVLSSNIMFILILAVYILSFLAVYKLAPVDSPNKPITTEKKKKRMRKNSYIILSVYLILSVLFLILKSKDENFNSFGVSLLLGTSWQIATLTKFGAAFLNKANSVVSYCLWKGGKQQ